MKLLVAAILVIGIVNARNYHQSKRILQSDDPWYQPMVALATEVIVSNFNIEPVRDLVQDGVEKCLQESNPSACLIEKVDEVCDALKHDVPQNERDDAKVKTGAIMDYLTSVHGACRDKEHSELFSCSREVGRLHCKSSSFGEEKCMRGVNFVLETAEKLFVDNDPWLQRIASIAAEVIVSAFNIGVIRPLVEDRVDYCVTHDDPTKCAGEQVDHICDVLPYNVSKTDRDGVKLIVEALADFFIVIHGSCKGKKWGDLKNCFLSEGDKFCNSQSTWGLEECKEWIDFVVSRMDEAGLGGMDRTDPWFEQITLTATNIIIKKIKASCMSDRVKENVEYCTLSFDPSNCLVKKGESYCKAFGHGYERMDCDKAKLEMDFLGNFVLVVHSKCSDREGESLKICAMEEGNKFCVNSKYDNLSCAEEIRHVLAELKL